MRDISQKLLVSLWEALNQPIILPRSYRYDAILAEAIKDGWFYFHRLEDLIYEGDRRLNSMHSNLKELTSVLGVQWTHTSRRPRIRSIAVIYSDAVRPAELASLLIDLESLGFSLDPQYLIDRLRPTVLKQGVLTDAELDIFWAPKIRHKREISLRAYDAPKTFGEWCRGKFPNGYRYETITDGDGRIVSLTVKGPKHRQRRNPVETKCPTCGYTWWRGDPDSSAAHREEHKTRMHVLAPQPHDLMIEAQRSDPDAELVTTLSPVWKHSEIYRRASAFKREEGYDFVQWQGSDGDNDPMARGFLFTSDNGTITGAAAFRWRVPDEKESPPFWGLQWVWIAPPFRRSGVLSSRWAALRSRFGDFLVESPVSTAMRAFLTRKGDEKLMKWPGEDGTQINTGWESHQPVSSGRLKAAR